MRYQIFRTQSSSADGNLCPWLTVSWDVETAVATAYRKLANLLQPDGTLESSGTPQLLYTQ